MNDRTSKNADYFEGHWADFEDGRVPESKLSEARRFLAPALSALSDAAAMTWLDVGCGDGIHLYVLTNEHAVRRVTGIDMSSTALERAKRVLGEQEARLIKGDARNLSAALPSDDPRVDVAFSYGVLAYTGDWRDGLAQMTAQVKLGGLVGFWMMAPPAGIGGDLFRLLRGVLRQLPNWTALMIANLMTPMLFIIPTRSGVTLRNASWRACVEVIMVNIAPRALVFPTLDEIVDQLDHLNLTPIHQDQDVQHAFWCLKG